MTQRFSTPDDELSELGEELLAGLRREFPDSDSDCSASEPLAPSIENQRDPSEVWAALAVSLPRSVLAILQDVHVDGLRIEILERVEREAFRWEGRREFRGRSTRPRLIDPVEAQRRWQALLASPRGAEALVRLRRIKDDVLYPIHRGQVLEGRYPEELPEVLQNVALSRDGILHVGGRPGNVGPGIAAYLERTPPEVVVLAAKTTCARLRRLQLRALLGAWDLSAGSGTGEATLRPLGWHVVATDLTNDCAAVDHLDCRNVGRHELHAGPGPHSGAPKSKVVRRPLLILFDPPSRGRPTHTELYNGCFPERDLAALDEATYIATIAAVVAQALACAHEAGCVSLLIREGTRNDDNVTATPGLANRILAAIESLVPVEVVLRHRVVEDHPHPQASLGRARLPMVHLLLGRRLP